MSEAVNNMITKVEQMLDADIDPSNTKYMSMCAEERVVLLLGINELKRWRSQALALDSLARAEAEEKATPAEADEAKGEGDHEHTASELTMEAVVDAKRPLDHVLSRCMTVH